MTQFYVFHCSSIPLAKDYNPAAPAIACYKYNGNGWVPNQFSYVEQEVNPLSDGGWYVWLDNAHVLCWMGNIDIPVMLAAKLVQAVPEAVCMLRNRLLGNPLVLTKACCLVGCKDIGTAYKSLPNTGKHLSAEEAVYDNFRNFLLVR